MLNLVEKLNLHIHDVNNLHHFENSSNEQKSLTAVYFKTIVWHNNTRYPSGSFVIMVVFCE